MEFARQAVCKKNNACCQKLVCKVLALFPFCFPLLPFCCPFAFLALYCFPMLSFCFPALLLLALRRARLAGAFPNGTVEAQYCDSYGRQIATNTNLQGKVTIATYVRTYVLRLLLLLLRLRIATTTDDDDYYYYPRYYYCYY